MMNNEMVGEFSFMDIVDGDNGVEVEMDTRLSRGSNDFTDNHEDFNIDMVEDEDGEFEDGEEVEVEEDFEDTSSITEALGQLGAIADDYELDFGSTKVQKGELVRLLGDRDSIVKTREAIDGFANRLIEKENILNVSFDVAKTETEKQLDHVYSMLNNPDKWHKDVDVQALQRARIQLEARKGELDVKATEAKAAIAEQKQQAAIFNVQKVVQEMGGNGPLNEAAKYAESKGMNLDSLVQNLSPAMVVALQNAAKYEALVSKNQAKLSATAQAKKPRSTPVKAKSNGKITQSARDKAWAQHKAGKLDHAAMFNFLAD